MNINISYKSSHILSNCHTTIDIDGCEHRIVGQLEELIDNPAVFIYENEIPTTFSLGWNKYTNPLQLMVNGIPLE